MIPKKHIKGYSRASLARSISDEVFSLILFPTEQCNFRCVYCYEDFEIGKMPEWLVQATKQLIRRKIPSLKSLSLSWFGGEPLLAKDIIYDISSMTLKLAKEHGCKLYGDLTTNGLLLDVKTLERLISLKQNRFQISIDGDQEFHDKTRLTKSGRGTFDKIWARLIDASNTDLEFNITLRVHVTDINQDSVLKFCDRFDKTLSGDTRFKLFFKAIENLGGKKEVKFNQLIAKRSAKEVVNELSKRYEKRSVQLGKSENYICYASKPNSLAIRANGDLNKCTVALSDDRNTVGTINKDGTLTINQQRYSSWIKGFMTLDSWQMGCPLSYMNSHSTVGDITIKKVS